MGHLFIGFLALLSFNCFGQTINPSLSCSKGTWEFPIANIKAVDTFSTGCIFRDKAQSVTFISASPDSVRSILEGTVVSILDFDGSYAIIIKNANYFIVYIGLAKPLSIKGQRVEKGSILGVLAGGQEDYKLSVMLYIGETEQDIKPWFNWNRKKINEEINATTYQSYLLNRLHRA